MYLLKFHYTLVSAAFKHLNSNELCFKLYFNFIFQAPFGTNFLRRKSAKIKKNKKSVMSIRKRCEKKYIDSKKKKEKKNRNRV